MPLSSSTEKSIILPPSNRPLGGRKSKASPPSSRALSATISILLIFMTFWQTLKQAGEIKESVRHAGRSADAMEGVKEAMAINAAKVVESVENQERFGKNA